MQAMYDGPNGRFQPLYANSGFMYFCNTPEVREFWAEVCANNELVGYYGASDEPASRDNLAPARPDGDVGGLIRLLVDIGRERDALVRRVAAMERSRS